MDSAASGVSSNVKPKLIAVGLPSDKAVLRDLKSSFALIPTNRSSRERPDIAAVFLLKSKDSCFRYIENLKSEFPSIPIVAVVRSDDARCAVEASRRGASEIMIHPVSADQFKRALERLRFTTDERGTVCEQVITASGAQKSFITCSASLIRMLEIGRRAAETDATVLITGESGTGKELLAAYIHGKSARAKSPFVAVNCAALPMELAESELFGHEKGAFTGAISRHKGKFELAHAGTLLLDEVGELDARLQAKLLRVLDDKSIWRVGSSWPITVDTRVIAITNSDLAKSTSDGRFREDLFYRLEVITIDIPPLRERKEDIPALTEHFLKFFCERYKRQKISITRDAMRILESHTWLGNVRELQNTIERVVLMCEPDRVEPEHITLERANACAEPKNGLDTSLNLEELERIAIKRALEHSSGNRTNAAKLLGITVRTLRNKLSRYREIFSYGTGTFGERFKNEVPAAYRSHVVH